MLTFEYDRKRERLCVHGDVEGLRSLQQYIGQLIDDTPEGKFDHNHLMTPDWGGSELTSDAQDAMAEFIHHVKMYCWKGKQPA